ncbi:MAG: YHS domain-containing protein [Luteolibacter sp.]
MKIKNIIAAGLFATVASFAATFAIAEEARSPAREVKPEEKKEAVKPYKPDTCIVSDEKLDAMGKPVVMVYQGQEIKFCCKKCKPKFEKDPATYLKKLEGK